MAQIPDYTALGQTPVPTPSYRRVMVDDSAAHVDEAIAGFGQTLERTGEQTYQRNVNFARSQASTSLIDHELAVKQQTEAIREQVASGQLPWDQAPKAFDDWNAKQQAPKIDNLDPMGQELLERGMKRNALGGTLAVQGIANAGRKQASADLFDTTASSLGKLAILPGADIDSINAQMDAYRPQALAAGLSAPVVDKAIQNFKDRNWLNQATQRGMEAKESLPALQQLQHDLTAADGFYAGKLDPEKRNMVLREVTNNQITLRNRIEHEQDKREAKAAGTINQINEQISTGVPLTPAMWSTAESVTKGTAAEPEFKQALKDEQTVQNVLRQSPADQAQYVEDAKQKLMTGGTMRDLGNVRRLETAVKQNTTMMEQQPLLFAANRNGTQVQPLDFKALSPPSPLSAAIGPAIGAPSPDEVQQQFSAQIADRLNTLTALRKQYGGQIGLKPLLPQEAAQLTNQLDNAAPKDRVQLLGALHSSVGNEDAYDAIMREIAPHSPLTAIAGTMLSRPTTPWFDPKFATDPVVPTRMLEGEQILRAKDEKGITSKFPMPDDKDLQAQFQSAVGGTNSDLFRGRPDTLQAAYAGYKALYAGEANHRGVSNGVINTDIAQIAAQSVVGHVTTYGSTNLVVPSGMDPTKFEGAVSTASQSALKAGGYSDKDIAAFRGYGLRELGDTLGTGRYVIIDGNGDALKSKTGQNTVFVDINKALSQYASTFTPQGDREFAMSGARATDIGDRR